MCTCYIQAHLNLNLEGLLSKLRDPGQRKNYLWIRGRISRMWSRWVAAAQHLLGLLQRLRLGRGTLPRGAL